MGFTWCCLYEASISVLVLCKGLCQGFTCSKCGIKGLGVRQSGFGVRGLNLQSSGQRG